MNDSGSTNLGTVLGIHMIGDNSSAAIFRNGELLAAVAEERLVRRKKTREFPNAAIDFCLAKAEVTSMDTVDHVAIAWNPGIQMKKINMSGYTSWRRYDPEWLFIVPNHLLPRLSDMDEELATLGFGGKGPDYNYVKHHCAHMGWAFASPYEEAAVAIVDEHGELVSTSLGSIHGNRIDVQRELPFVHSLGVFYATFTQYLGFRPYSDEWKVMGAAAYGDPKAFAGKLREIIKFGDGDLVLDQFFFEFHNTRIAGYFSEKLENFLDVPAKSPGEPMDQRYFDLAASVQDLFEEVLFSLLCWLHERVRLKNLVLNGGCCMNSLACGKVIENTPFENVFVSPASSDLGTSIGACLWLQGTRSPQHILYRPKISAFTGPEYALGDIQKCLDRAQIRYKSCEDVVGDTVQLLVAGKIVGWFHGRMEFGERALGNRSILADPRRAEMKDRVNASIKYREEFRPLAPSILAECAEEYFDLPPSAQIPFMDQVYRVKVDKRDEIPAVVHEDGTGRLQTVTKEDNALFHELIRRFKNATGIPVLLNTSFNISGEPIVASPEDALGTFFRSGLDALVIGNFLIMK